MRHADMLAAIIAAGRKAADDHASRLTAAEGRVKARADARADAIEEKVDKLAADIAGLADATRAVLLRQRDPEPPAAKRPMAAKSTTGKER